MLTVQLATRADAAYDRALEIAGSRILNAAQKVPAFRGRFTSRAKADIPSAVSPADLAAMRVNASLLLDGAWTDFGLLARDWLADYLAGRGATRAAAESDAARLTAGLVAELGKWGSANFHGARVRNRSSGLRVPVGVFAAVCAEAAQHRTLEAVG